jgi:cation:H+ antiporter
LALSVSWIGLGIVVLAYSGSKLVDLAVALAEKLRLTPAVIGLLIVAWGTSMPEAVVSVTAALRGSPEIAIANVVGSNIANIGLILGACALLTAIPVSGNLLRFEYPFLLLASWLALLLSRDGKLDRLESLFFLVSVLAFSAYSLWAARQHASAAEIETLGQRLPEESAALAPRSLAQLLIGLALAFAGLVLGAHFLIQGAVALARGLGVSERVIGLTLVAVGTSLPELVASLAAALKKQLAMAVTNIVGSNICNLLLILGTAGLVRPIPVAERLVSPDMWVMLGMAALLYPLAVRDRCLKRRDGVILLSAYAAYTALVVATR